ncbi:MAG: response regulator [Asticcacaulis sp.]
MSKGLALIVDSSREQAQALAAQCELRGWSTLLSFDADIALRTLATTKVNLLVLNMYTGKINTLTRLSAFREAAPGVPVLMLTEGGRSPGALADIKDARKAGVDHVLPKPVDRMALCDILEEVQDAKIVEDLPLRVMVIDDASTVRSISRRILMDEGYTVFTADTVETAMFSPELPTIQVVVMDIFMPGMGGIEGIAALKKMHPHLRILAISGGKDATLGANQVLMAARHVGADATLPKPFDEGRFVEMIRELSGAAVHTIP